MKLQSLITIIIVSMTWMSCNEIMPFIPEPKPPDDIEKKVLIEEFTGVNCVQCPAGSAEIENLISIYGDNLVAISVHAGFFATPNSQNEFDFRTQDGDDLASYLGEPIGYPSAVVDRKIFNGQTDLQSSQSEWAGFISSQFELKPVSSLTLSQNYDSANRALSFEASGIFNQVPTEVVYISAVMTESGIVDGQITPNGWNQNYVHKHLYRGAITNFDGEVLGSSFSLGDGFSRSFNFTIPTEWNAANCELIVYLHYNEDKKEILQVESVHLEE